MLLPEPCEARRGPDPSERSEREGVPALSVAAKKCAILVAKKGASVQVTPCLADRRDTAPDG